MRVAYRGGNMRNLRTTDVAVVGGGLAGLTAAALLAAWIPARSAARIDPVTALRAE